MNKSIIILLVLALIGTGAFVIYLNNKTTKDNIISNAKVILSSTSTSSQSVKSTSSAANQGTATNVKNTKYENGEYTVTVSYKVPEGNTESITVKIKLEDDKVISVTNSYVATNRESREWQDRFQSSINSAVVNKDISTLSLSRIGRASLTTDAFNNAITKIKSQAEL